MENTNDMTISFYKAQIELYKYLIENDYMGDANGSLVEEIDHCTHMIKTLS